MDCVTHMGEKRYSRAVRHVLTPLLIALLPLTVPHGATASEPATFKISDLIAYAVDTHPSIRVKQQEYEAAHAELEGANYLFYPTPSLSYGKSQGQDLSVAKLSQPLWTGGRLTANRARAQAGLQASEAGVDEARYDIALQVAEQFRVWMQAHSRAMAKRREIGRLGTYQEMIRRRVTSGASAEVDKSLLESRLAQSRSELELAETAVRRALLSLSQLTSMNLQSGDLIYPKLSQIEKTEIDLSALLREAVSINPSLQRGESEIEVARFERRIKQASLSPTVSVVVEYAFGSDVARRQYGDDEDRQIALSVDYALGAGLSTFSALKAGESRITGLLENREVVRRKLVEQIQTENEQFSSTKAQLKNLSRTRSSTIRVLESYRRLFSAGKRGWLDVMNAAREVTQVEMTSADVSANLISTFYRLNLYGGNLP